MKLDLSSLTNATTALERSINAAKAYETTIPSELRDTVRSGIIQNFTVAYTLSWKTMQRWLEMNVSVNAVDGVSRRELFRYAAEHRLIHDVDVWMCFHTARDETPNTYDGAVAEEVGQIAKRFVSEAQALITSVHSRNG